MPPAVKRSPPQRPDIALLVAGIVIGAFGGVLMLDRVGEVNLHFAVLAPAVCFVLGAILLASGLSREES